MDNLVGQTVGQYQLVELIHQGENTVYKAFQPSTDRYVAVKMLSPARRGDPAYVQQFQQDMQVAATLQHPNILSIYDFGQYNQYLYTVTPYVDGGTVETNMGQFTEATQAQKLIETLSGALEFMHGRGVIYGNLKPANILLDRQGQPLLTDYGYSQGIDVGLAENAYLSPELIQNGTLDRRTDTYALGMLLYELLTGQVPQPGTMPNLRLYRPDLPVGVEQVILKAVAPEPDQRFQTAAELNQALKTALGLAPVPPLQTAPPPPAQPEAVAVEPGSKRSWWLAGGVAILLLALLALCAGLVWFNWFGGEESSGGGSNIIVVVPTPAPQLPSVTAEARVNIRSGPGLDYDVVGALEQGQSAEAVGRSPDMAWWAIKVDGVAGGQGWVANEFVAARNTDNVPILQPPALPTTSPTQPTPEPDEPPLAVIEAPAQGEVGQALSFDANGSQSANRITSYAWEFGDGGQANAVQVEHIYQSVGTFNVILTVTDANGLTGSANAQVEIELAPEPTEEPEPEPRPTPTMGALPEPVIVAPPEAQVGVEVLFDGSQSQPGSNPIAEYNWDFGDGAGGSGPEVSHIYDAPGVYQVTLTVTDEVGFGNVAGPVEITITEAN